MRPRSGATGDSLKEAIAINQSLSCLGTVINALTDQHVQAHIPYRSSKLTHLLEDSLGGNSHTVMLAACSPSPKSYFETLSTLQYAARAKLIICNPKVHKHEEERKADEAAEGTGKGKKEKKVYDWMPRYLRLDGYTQVCTRAWHARVHGMHRTYGRMHTCTPCARMMCAHPLTCAACARPPATTRRAPAPRAARGSRAPSSARRPSCTARPHP